MEEVLSEPLIYQVLGTISARSVSYCVAVCRGWQKPSQVIFIATIEAEFAAVIPSVAARQQLVRLMGAPAKSAMLALHWRRQATKRAQRMQMLQTNIEKSIGGASLDGSDVFAACKRAVLFSDEASGAAQEIERWMNHVVEAVESKRFAESMPAWRWFAEHGVLEDGSIRWMLELAHSLGDLKTVAAFLCECPDLRQHVEAYAKALEAEPDLGRYSVEGGRIRDRDVWGLLKRVP